MHLYNATYILIAWFLTDSVLQQNLTVKYFEKFSDADETIFQAPKTFSKTESIILFLKKSVFSIVNLAFTWE